MEATLIIQKEIIDDLFIRENEFLNFINFVKKKFRNYTLITNHNDERDFIEHSEENPFLEILIDKFEKIKYIKDLKNLIKNKNILNQTSIRTIVICDIDDVLCNEYLENHGILLFNLSILKKWNLYEDILHSKNLKVTKNSKYQNSSKFNSYNDFTKYLKFCNSVVIFDKYLFENKSNQKIENNLLKMLESMVQMNSKMKLMIVSEFKEDEICSQYNKIHKHLTSKGYKNFKFCLIHHSKALYPKKFEGLHSRFILSNYVHIRSNDSFNFFKDNGDFNNLADIDINFCLSKENYDSYDADLNAIKLYISKIKNEPNCPNKSLKTTFFKDKKNNLLN